MGSTPAPGTYSGSQVSAIIGLNQYKTQTEAWQEICEELEPGFNASKGYRFPEKPDNASIRWGHAFEPANIKLSEERDNLVIKDLEHTKKPTALDSLECFLMYMKEKQPTPLPTIKK
ncbi:MAG: YqaJ viral recombinase family protein [Reinekea sp.]